MPQEKRTARFVCVIAAARDGRTVATFRGTAEGIVLDVPRGENGFGYDPLFYFPQIDKTFAELTRGGEIADTAIAALLSGRFWNGATRVAVRAAAPPQKRLAVLRNRRARRPFALCEITCRLYDVSTVIAGHP